MLTHHYGRPLNFTPLHRLLSLPVCVCAALISSPQTLVLCPSHFTVKLPFSLSRIAQDYLLLPRSAELASGITADPFSIYFWKRWKLAVLNRMKGLSSLIWREEWPKKITGKFAYMCKVRFLRLKQRIKNEPSKNQVLVKISSDELNG